MTYSPYFRTLLQYFQKAQPSFIIFEEVYIVYNENQGPATRLS